VKGDKAKKIRAVVYLSPDQDVSSHCPKNGNRERGFSQECEILLSFVIAFKK
jgi:hypothetical protein